MIDLVKLEAEIDALLESETTESLMAFLNSKRKNDFKFLGEGIFENLKSNNAIVSNCGASVITPNSTLNHSQTGDRHYFAMAA